jgi:hypothetical protein
MKRFALLPARALACALTCLSAAAQAAEMPYPPGARPQALRLAADDPALRIDGRLDEAVWQRAPVHDAFVQFLPEDKRPALLRTTVQVVLTEHDIVFGIRAYDPQPERIRAQLTRRDNVRRDQDFVMVALDAVGQRRAAQFARISAAGVIADGVFTAEDDGEDFAPDFDLEAAVQRLADGYSVELRWPIASLRFPYADGAPWRLMVSRSVPREASVLLVSAPLSKEALSFIAELQEIGGLDDLVERVRERSFLSVRPELTARRTRDSEGGNPAQRRSQWSLGAEIKWRPRADWVIDATLNPDFSQVELDTPQLAGNTRFALSVPEKRPFFLESTDVIGLSLEDDQGMARGLAAFYSRSITDPEWGLRSTWRGARDEATAMSLRDAGGGQVLRAQAYGTAAYAQSLRSQASFARGRWQYGAFGLGALASLRDYGHGQSNRVLGLDGAWHLGGEDQLRGHALFSSTSAGFDAQGRPLRIRAQDGHNLWLSWRHSSADWSNTAHLEDISPRFANDNGFVSQSGVRRASLQLHRRLGVPESMAPFGEWSRHPLFEAQAQLLLKQTSSLRDTANGVRAGEVIERRIHPGFWFVSARNTEVWAHLSLDQQRARAGGLLHPLRTFNAGFGSNPAPWLTYITGEIELGRRLDVEADRVGGGASVLLEAKLRLPLPLLPAHWSLELEQRIEQGYVRRPPGERGFTDRAARTLAVLHVSALDSLRGIVQKTGYQRRAEPAAGLLDDELRGHSLSLVYQHKRGLGRSFSLGFTSARAEPGRARSSELFVKASHTFDR